MGVENYENIAKGMPNQAIMQASIQLVSALKCSPVITIDHMFTRWVFVLTCKL